MSERKKRKREREKENTYMHILILQCICGNPRTTCEGHFLSIMLSSEIKLGLIELAKKYLYLLNQLTGPGYQDFRVMKICYVMLQ